MKTIFLLPALLGCFTFPEYCYSDWDLLNDIRDTAEKIERETERVMDEIDEVTKEVDKTGEEGDEMSPEERECGESSGDGETEYSADPCCASPYLPVCSKPEQ